MEKDQRKQVEQEWRKGRKQENGTKGTGEIEGRRKGGETKKAASLREEWT